MTNSPQVPPHELSTSHTAATRERNDELAAISPHLEELMRAPVLGIKQSRESPGDYLLTLNQPIDPEYADLARPVPQNPNPYLHRSRRIRSIRTRSHAQRLSGLRGLSGLSGIQMIGILIAGLACLLGFNRVFIGKPHISTLSTSIQSTHPSFTRPWTPVQSQVWGSQWRPQSWVTAPAPSTTKHYDGTITRDGYVLTVATRGQNGAVSARVLIVTPMQPRESSGMSPDAPQLRRAESDTTLLQEIAPDTWSGRLVTYLFIEQNGHIVRIPAYTEVALRSSADTRSAQATIELSGRIPDGIRQLAEVQGLSMTSDNGGQSVMLRDQVALTASVSF